MRLQESSHFSLCLKPSGSKTFKRLCDDRCHWLIANKYPAAMFFSWRPAIAARYGENGFALFETGGHFLDHLAAVLSSLQFGVRSNKSFKEFALGRIFKSEIQAFAGRVASLHFTPELQVKLNIARVAFEIIENDDVLFFGMGIEIG
ncbi:MAG: hypothetical protein MRY64_14790 [Hyphomonadaceae bacterium]|nr:hypothetical protein [Hyphomonadaceae bacterium]